MSRTIDQLLTIFGRAQLSGLEAFAAFLDRQQFGANAITLYGAVADAQQVSTTASMVPGSTTLTVGSPVFTVADIGKIIALQRTDVVNGTPPWWSNVTAARVVIRGYVSPTQVVLSIAGGSNPNTGESWPWALVPCTLTWGTDNASAFQQACDAVKASPGGGTVYVPPGVYAIGSQVVLSSYTRVYGAGVSSAIYCCSSDAVGMGIGPFSNAAAVRWWPTLSQVNSGADYVPNFLANNGDAEIVFDNLLINSKGLTNPATTTCKVICLIFVTRTCVRRVRFIGAPMNPQTAVAAIGCDDHEVSDCRVTGVSRPLDHWSGTTRIRVLRNVIDLPVSVENNSVCVQVNPEGPGPREAELVYQIAIEDNIFELNGATGSWLPPWAVQVNDLISESPIQAVHIRRNQIRATGTYNNGIYFGGMGQGVDVSDNLLEGVVSKNYGIITVSNVAMNTVALPSGATISTVSGSNQVTVAWPGHGVALANTQFGTPYTQWVTAGPLVIGGITLNDTMPVVAVPDVNTLVCQAPNTASSTTSGTWTPGFVAIYEFPFGSRISNNTLRDCINSQTTNGGGIIRIAGAYSSVVGNQIILSPGVTANYTCMIAVSPIGDGTPVGFFAGNSGPSGTLSNPGWNGTARIAWNPYNHGVQPVIIDPDIAGDTLSFGANSLAMTGGTLGFYGSSPISQPTVTGSKGGNAALASVITALKNLGLVVDTTT